MPLLSDDFFRWLEATSLSVWTRESTSVLAFPAILSAHAIGMALAAGIGLVIALRILGAARPVPVIHLRSFVPLLWAGFGINALSGLLLLIAYPTKALTNPVFYVKLLAIAVAVATFVSMLRRLRTEVPAAGQTAHGATRVVAAVSVAAWVTAIFAGRLLAYTYHRLLADF